MLLRLIPLLFVAACAAPKPLPIFASKSVERYRVGLVPDLPRHPSELYEGCEIHCPQKLVMKVDVPPEHCKRLGVQEGECLVYELWSIWDDGMWEDVN
jgi:hypothetical protein